MLRYTLTIEKIKIINVCLKKENAAIQISALYWTPSSDIKNFNTDLYNYINEINKNMTFNYSFFVGDINIDILKDNELPQEYLSILNEAGYTSPINNYTRIQNNAKTCLDHIFVKLKKA